MRVETKHDLSANEVAVVEHCLYEHNHEATGARDGQDLEFVIRDETGDVVGAAHGYSWAGIAELKQLWVAERYRGRGMGRAPLDSFVDEARRRGVSRIWLASYDFQAPLFYERAGFVRVADLKGAKATAARQDKSCFRLAAITRHRRWLRLFRSTLATR
jgi:N-acetylglutamate synthase-like GNAT family acetyltransferase